MRNLLILTAIVLASCAGNSKSSSEANAEPETTESKFLVQDFGSFKLHAQLTNDPLGDMSFIVEGAEGLVVVEPAAFHSSIAEQQAYVQALGKPVVCVIADYHMAGLTAYPAEAYRMVEGMPEFVRGEIYSGMMAGFAQAFGDAIADEGELPTQVVAREGEQQLAGIDFTFSAGAASDFPGASVLVGGKVYYTHFSPVAGLHMNPLQITGRPAVEAQLAELKHAKATGAEAFVGGHGIGIATMADVDFQIDYLETVKKLMDAHDNAETFAEALKAAYPEAGLQENVSALAANLYK